MMMIEARSAADLDTVRRLFEAYAASLPFSLEYQGFDEELARLPAPYAPPAGCLLLALDESEAVGVVGLKPLVPGIAEIKRLYIVPEARGRGLGGALAAAAIEAARARGYERVRLDTHKPSMDAAIALYRRLGFAEIPPYGANPGGAFLFLEKQL